MHDQQDDLKVVPLQSPKVRVTVRLDSAHVICCWTDPGPLLTRLLAVQLFLLEWSRLTGDDCIVIPPSAMLDELTCNLSLTEPQVRAALAVLVQMGTIVIVADET